MPCRTLIDGDLFDPEAANLDLYGGVGLLAAAVGDRFGDAVRITTVESDARATEHAGDNLADWVGARAVTARVDRFLDELADGVRPRPSGHACATRRSCSIRRDPAQGGEVVDRLAELRPRQLVYVACDPVALARGRRTPAPNADTSSPTSRAFDLFPNTHHVEAVARPDRYRVTAEGGRHVSDAAAARSGDASRSCDDHEAVRLGLRAACRDAGYEVVAETVERARPHRVRSTGSSCDVVVLDLSLGDGSSVTENVRARARHGQRRARAQHRRPRRRACARRSPPAPRASSPRRRRSSTVIGAIATVAKGEVLNNVEWASAIEADRDFAKAQLGRRERDVLHLYASGLPLKLVGDAARHRALDRTRVPRPHPREVRRGRPTRADEGRPPAASRGRRHPPRPRRRGRRCPPLNGGSRASRRAVGRAVTRAQVETVSGRALGLFGLVFGAADRCRSRWRSPRRSSREPDRP